MRRLITIALVLSLCLVVSPVFAQKSAKTSGDTAGQEYAQITIKRGLSFQYNPETLSRALKKAGIKTVGDLQRSKRGELARVLGQLRGRKIVGKRGVRRATGTKAVTAGHDPMEITLKKLAPKAPNLLAARLKRSAKNATMGGGSGTVMRKKRSVKNATMGGGSGTVMRERSKKNATMGGGSGTVMQPITAKAVTKFLTSKKPLER